LIVRASRSRLRSNEIDRQQPLRKLGALDLHPVRQKKAALELPGRDASMQIFTRLVLLLPAADRKLALSTVISIWS
jgi:hypothetical protein